MIDLTLNRPGTPNLLSCGAPLVGQSQQPFVESCGQ